MQLTIELTEEQMAELDEVSQIKQLSREALAVSAVQDYLEDTRAPRVTIDHEKLDALMKRMAATAE